MAAWSLVRFPQGTQSETMSVASLPLEDIEFTLSSGSDESENKSQLSSVVEGGEMAPMELETAPAMPTARILPSGERPGRTKMAAPALALPPAPALPPALNSETPPVDTDDDAAVAGDITRSRESFELFSKFTRSE